MSRLAVGMLALTGRLRRQRSTGLLPVGRRGRTWSSGNGDLTVEFDKVTFTCEWRSGGMLGAGGHPCSEPPLRASSCVVLAVWPESSDRTSSAWGEDWFASTITVSRAQWRSSASASPLHSKEERESAAGTVTIGWPVPPLRRRTYQHPTPSAISPPPSRDS